MISVAQADQIISDAIKRSAPVVLPIDEVYGLVLAEDVVIDRNYPPFNKAIMDGIAINRASYDKGNRVFPIEGVQAAGIAQQKLKNEDGCYEIMTGAVVPEGCDWVIPVEKVVMQDGKAQVTEVDDNSFIRQEGIDGQKGTVVLNKGDVLTAPRIAVCVSVGKANVSVYPKISIAVVSTGDELVTPDKEVLPHQIRSSNDHFIKAALEKHNRAACTLFHFKDDAKELKVQLAALLDKYDCLVLSGGVSAGKFDLIPDVLKELSVECLFHKVLQKPGKPMWFGVSPKGQPVFGLPGNPVSTYTCSLRFIRKHLLSVECCLSAKSSVDFDATLDVTEYKMVKFINTNDGLCFEPIAFGGSGDLISIIQSDGFVEIPAEKECINKNDLLSVYAW